MKTKVYTDIIKYFFPWIHEFNLNNLLREHNPAVNFTSYYICNISLYDSLIKLEHDLEGIFQLQTPLQWNCYNEEFFIRLGKADADNYKIPFYIKDNISKYVDIDLVCWGFSHWSNSLFFKSESLKKFYEKTKKELEAEINKLPYKEKYKAGFIKEVL